MSDTKLLMPVAVGSPRVGFTRSASSGTPPRQSCTRVTSRSNVHRSACPSSSHLAAGHEKASASTSFANRTALRTSFGDKPGYAR